MNHKSENPVDSRVRRPAGKKAAIIQTRDNEVMVPLAEGRMERVDKA